MGLDSGRKLEESEHLGGFSVGGCVRASLTIFSIEIEPTEEMGGGRRGRGRERKKKEGRKEGEEGRREGWRDGRMEGWRDGSILRNR